MAKWDANRPEDRPRSAGDLRCPVADKGYDDISFRAVLRAVGVQPLIKHRVFAPYDHAHNARIDDELYQQRSTTESVNSSIKRSHGSAVWARDWYRQFRENVLIAGVHNIERAIDARTR